MNPNDPYLDNQIDLTEMFQALWDEKKLIILITAIFAISSVVYSLQLKNYYQSISLVVSRSDTLNQQALSSQISGLGAMMGINLGSSGDGKALQAIELIKSRKFVKHLLTFDNILPSIMAPKSYNNSSKELLFNQEIYDSETKIWKRKPTKNGRIKPSYLEAYKVYMESLVSISKDKKTNFISIHVEHISPVFAKQFLELIIREANTLIRNKDMEESSKALIYLKSELSNTSFVAIQESINSLIKVQLERRMLTQINEDYILIEIEPPFIAEEKSGPQRLRIVVFTTIIGFFLSMLIVLVRHNYLGKETK
jgi:LPS O-antigen subunit length determinant protein (WzzB/FepE family)